MRLSEPDSGTIALNGYDLSSLHGYTLRQHRAKFQMVFQDPLAAFNPRRNIGQILQVPLALHGTAYNADQQISAILERVGLNAYMARRMPRELSGGPRRVCLFFATRMACTSVDVPAYGSALRDLFAEAINNQRKSYCSRG